VKDDSSSSSSEKEDHSAELEEWKKKHDKVKSDYEQFRRKTSSEIEELNITITNLEKRNVELKLLLRRNNVDITESPEKVGSTTVQINVEETSIQVKKVDISDSEKSEKYVKKEKKEKKDKKKKSKSKSKKKKKDSSSSESDYSDAISERSDFLD